MVLIPRHLKRLGQSGIQTRIAWISKLITVAAFAWVGGPIASVSLYHITKQVRNAARASGTTRPRIDLSQPSAVTSDIPICFPSRIIKETVDRISGVITVNGSELP